MFKEIERVKLEDYEIHFSVSNTYINFTVYSIVNCSDGTHMYVLKEYKDNPHTPTFDKKLCFGLLGGSYIYRGMYESRLYFHDDEYWGDQLKELHGVFSDHVEPWCQKWLKENDKYCKEAFEKGYDND